jgi:transcriptional regulator with XRE-family HTH domain
MIKETSALTIMGLLLKEARLEKKETQSSISKYVGMTNAGWGRLENGKSSLSVENMMLACDFLEMTPNLLFININRITSELKNDGWSVDISNVENDGLLIGRDLESSHFSKRLLEDKPSVEGFGSPFFGGVAAGTLNGAAASSAGLAAIGGGSLAAGGAGVAGGVAARTLSGAAASSAGLAAIGGGSLAAGGAGVAASKIAKNVNDYAHLASAADLIGTTNLANLVNLNANDLESLISLSTTFTNKVNKRESGSLIRKLAAIYIKSKKLFI